MIRIGNSLDAHSFTKGNGFKLGGIFIEADLAVVAHSDGDCLLHSIAESLLGSLALGSLGEHYPDTSSLYKDKDSTFFLLDAYQKIKDRGYEIVNIDSMILLDRPKLKEKTKDMEKYIAKVLELNLDQVSVKATTLEGLASLSKEGVTCLTSVLVTNEK